MELLPYRQEKMTEDVIDRAREELGETGEVRIRCLAQAKKYIKDQKNLRCTDEDIFFLSFLRKGKYDMKKVAKLFQAYFREKKNFPEIFSMPNYQAFRRCFELQLASVLPFRDRDGSAVVVFRADKWNPNEFKFANIVHFMAITLLATVEYDVTQVCGVKILLSAKGLSLSHLVNVQFRYLILLARGIRSCLPVRVKGIHFINENVHLQFLWNLISFTLGAKLRSRVHFHGSDFESIQEFIDPAVIPKDFGGNLKDDPSFSMDEFERKKDVYVSRLVGSGYC